MLHIDLSVKINNLELGALGSWDIASLRNENDLEYQDLDGEMNKSHS